MTRQQNRKEGRGKLLLEEIIITRCYWDRKCNQVKGTGMAGLG